ncbi:UNVERIFIED_CONTAM: SH3-domain kinase binding protein 1 [Siphonaria sp. JEL0065]|nr:SH3-domain kinase binding protein 1 [Siphonaria sp. JEL0065]
MTASLTSNKDQQCNLGVAPELNACGFSSDAQSKAYCGSVASNGDLCCNFPTGVQFAVLGSDGQYHLPNSAPEKSSGPSVGLIAGGAVGGLALLAIIGAGVFIYMKKNKSSSNSSSSRYQPDEYKPEYNNYNNNNNNSYNNAAYPPSKPYQPPQQQYQQPQSNYISPSSPKQQSLGRPHPSQQQHQQHPAQYQKSIPQQQPQFPPQPSKQGGEIMRIIHSYEPQLQDELALVEGDDLILVKRFDDGWAQGVNPLSGKQGAFPLVCVCSIHELHTSKPQSQKKQATADRISKRMSSMATNLSTAPISPGNNNNGIAPASPVPSATSSGSGGKKKQTTVRILFPYAATQEDELDLVVGNDLIILKSFDDGWALGMHPLTGQKGAFPLACVGKPDDQFSAQQQEDARRVSNRVSSLLEWQE